MPLAYQSFVINLDRQGARYQQFLSRNRATGLDFQRFPAVDGAAVDEATRQAAIAKTRRGFQPGAIGVALSHRMLWQNAVAARRPIAVFEDDAVLRSDFATAVPNLIAGIRAFWDIVLLGLNTDAVLVVAPGVNMDVRTHFPRYPGDDDLHRFQSGRDAVTLHRLYHAFGLCGYLISPRGAERLLAQCFPMNDRPIVSPFMAGAFTPYGLDGILNGRYAAHDAYVCWPPLVLTANDQATSTTQATPGKAAAKRQRK